MFVLHAIWDCDRLCLWAESSDLPLKAPARRGRRPKNPKPITHPFALSGEALKEVIKDTFGKTQSEIEKKTLLLPSTKKGPLPSPWLILYEDHSAENSTGLAAWDIEALTFDPYSTFDLLIDMPIHSPHGLSFGDSLRFWNETAKFSLEFITKQEFIPVIKANNALWTAVINEEDQKRVKTLSNMMPPSCRAFFIHKDDESHPQSQSPYDLVKSFIDQTVDAFVKKSLTFTSLLPPHRGRQPKVTPLLQQFIKALSSEKSSLDAPCDVLNSFSGEIETWLFGLQPSTLDAQFHTCFRLEEPSDSGIGDKWTVKFFLQAKDDRSLLVPSEKVWKTRSDTLTFLKRSFKNPQEQLLCDLAKASIVLPQIERSLQTACPSGIELEAEEAYSFLRQSAPLLEQDGFGVLLPSWWEKPGSRIGVKVKIKASSNYGGGGTGTGLFDVKSILGYEWEVAIGDKTLSFAEFEELSGLKVPLVQVRGEWVELRMEDVEAAINFFKKKHESGEMTLLEAMRLLLSMGSTGDVESEVGLPIIGIEAEGWIKDMLRTFSADGDAGIIQIKTPKAFKGNLRPYQVKGVSWLKYLHEFGLCSCLADDMGLGKTIELIAFLLHEREGKQKKHLLPTLLICPMSVSGNWEREVERFAPSLKVMVHHGTDRLTKKAFLKEAKKQDLVITTYALAYRDEKTLSKINWQHLVLDEAQNIKNPGAKQTQAIKRLKSEHRIALTGTPVENRLSELWSIMDFLNPMYLGSAQGFRKEFVLPIEKYRNKERAEMLKSIIQPFILRRLKTDSTIINDLPEKMEMRVFCNLTSEQASLYKAVVTDMLEKIDESEGIERKGLVLATLTKLKQICNHPAAFIQDGSTLKDRSGKLTRLEEMLDVVLFGGDKALIFTQYAAMGAMLRHHLQGRLGCEVLFLHGGTKKKMRDQMILRFQSDGPPIFILSLKAGGFGLNLTGANHVFHFDRWWNPAVENQATDRVFRIGQKKNVFVHKFVCIGTLEERIDQMIEEKKKLSDAVIGAGEAWLTELSTDELREVFLLSRDAIGGN